MDQKLLILCGPSGSGKTTLAHHLMEEMPELMFSISATTRPKRQHEINGTDYYFITADEFRRRIEDKEFLEFEQVYDGLYYGTFKKELNRIWNFNKLPVLDIDVFGARSVKRIYPNALTIFVHPVSLENIKSRLLKRATETVESYAKRIAKAEEELSYSGEFDKVIYNDNLEQALEKAEQYVHHYISAQN